MRSRIFFKLLAAFVLVIAAATVIFDFWLHHDWKGALLALVVTLVISAIAAQATARRLNRIMQFAGRVTA